MLPSFEIPTFTVTINPLESNEMTYVPGSPTQEPKETEDLSQKLIANMTVIVDDEVNNKLVPAQVHFLSRFLAQFRLSSKRFYKLDFLYNIGRCLSCKM